jgi:type II secretion system protein H
MATRRTSVSTESGFTLIEIMVAIVIFAIIVAISFPMLAKANRTHRLNAAAGRVETELMRARSTAVTQQTPVRVSFNAGDNTVQLDQDRNNDGTFDTALRTINIDMDVAMANVSFNGGNIVIFDQRGAPNSPGTVLMGNGGETAQRVMVAAGSGAVWVESIPYTDGYVQMQ